jgi:metallo-beta-lactamase family protein
MVLEDALKVGFTLDEALISRVLAQLKKQIMPLGAPYTPLLPAPQAPARADILVIESTYGDRLHESRKDRRQRLQAICEHAFGNRGTLLITAFSIGCTQELLYELEEIFHRNALKPAA